VRNSGDFLLTIVNDVLDFSKIEAGKLTLDDIDLDLALAVEEVAGLLAGQAHAKGIELTYVIDPAVPPLLRGDPARIRQILTNLIGKAIKFTHDGEVSIRVSALAAELDGRARIEFEVRDTGIGILPAVHARLFQAFTQADGSTTRRYGGTGLGLAISKRLTELMRGEIGVKSQPGVGSVFWFRISFEIQEASVPLPSSNVDLAGLRVLLVDDNRTNLEILRGSASGCGVWRPKALRTGRKPWQ
jgi:signal transduction histidine kinase